MVEDMYILYSTILFVESVVLCRYRDITGYRYLKTDMTESGKRT